MEQATVHLRLSMITGRINRALIGLRRLAVQAWAGPGLPVLFVAVYTVAYPARFPLLTWYDTAHITFASSTSYHPLAALGLVLAGLALVVLCWQMGRVAQTLPRRTAILLILSGWLGACACALLTYPGQSTDMGDYIFRAHMLIHLGHNPMTTPPSALIAWEEFPYLSWLNAPDYYGPLWHWLSGATHALAGENLLANFLAYKLLGLAAVGFSGLLIYLILRRRTAGYAVAGLGLWLWNPVVINEGVMHGHNDLVMIPLILSGIGLLLRSEECGGSMSRMDFAWRFATDVAGILLLGAAGLVKATMWILLPVAAVWLVRRRGFRQGVALVAVGLLAGAALVWLAYRPFGGWDLIITMAQKRGWWPANSWSAALFFGLRDGAGWPHAVVKRLVLGGTMILWAFVAGLVMLRLRDLCQAAWAVTLAYLLIGSIWFQPWYATIIISLACLVPIRHVTDYTLVLSFFMLLHPVVEQFLASRVSLPPGGYHLIMSVTVLLVPQAIVLIMLFRSHVASRLRIFPGNLKRNPY